VSVVRLSDAREKSLNIVLNNQEAQGRYDTEKLADLLGELGDTPELELTGFDARTLSTLRLGPAPAEDESASDPNRLEITLVTTAETYERFARELDALVGEYDLVTHIRRG